MSSVGTPARRTHYRTCNLCEAMCGLAIELEDERIVAIRGDDDDPFSRGHICPKAVALGDVHSDPDRLRHPVRRTEDGWKRIAWDDALDRVADGLARVRERHGPDSVALYFGNPNVHNLGSMLCGSALRRALGTRNVYSATSVDQLPHHVAARHMFGHYFLLPIPDVDRSDFFLVLGANPVASNGSLMTAPGIRRRIRDLRARGGRVVVVDPRRTETAREADRHYFIAPGTDALLLLALLRTLFDDDLVAVDRLEELIDGVETVERLTREFTPEAVAPRVRIPAAEIRRLAREFAVADRAVCYGRIGVSTQLFGGLCQWLINVLNILTGNLDRPGGAMFPTPAFDIVDRERNGRFGRWRSRVRGLPEFTGELPAAALAEEILTPGEGRVRALLTVAGNPVLSTPNGTALDEALATLDFVASIDIYVNETTRHADVVLPPTTGLECEHYDVVFHALAVRNTAKYSPPLFQPATDARHDWQIFRQLAQRLATDDRPFDPTDPRNVASPSQILDHGLRTGAYADRDLSLQALRDAPHGVDLGPLEPRLPERLCTSDGRIDLAPAPFVDDLDRLRATRAEEERPGLLALIGRRDLRSNNSWMHNSRRLVRGRDRCTLMIHPDDAAARRIRAGQRVAVASRTGRIELPAEITETIMPGVVSIPHGWGHHRAGVRLSVAAAHPGASINDLTDDRLIDSLTGNAALSGVPVSVEPL